MTRSERYEGVISYFSSNMPDAETELRYKNPFELLVAVILSAQCTDKRVNLVTPELFANYPDAKHLALADPEEVFPFISSVSYPNNKSRHLVGMANVLIDEFNNVIPDTRDELVKLPGVGRKTANVIASVIYKKPTMAVDTHVFRVSNRIGLTINAKTPLASEKQLVKYFPENLIKSAHHWLILHGRYVCIARKPKCDSCGISEYCKYYKTNYLKQKK